jgi:hypothetical protein
VSLTLYDTPVTSAGLVHLDRLKSLEELNLSKTHVDNDGLAVLKSLPKLRMVWLTGPRVTQEAANELVKALPKADVQYARPVPQPGLR